MTEIPHVIHYCWFGGKELPNEVERCLSSWLKFCPEYQIIRWDESNYDISKCEFVKRAYDEKKWAFVSDYARLDIVYNHGGVYLDTDVELIKSLDDILSNSGEGFWGFENNEFVASGLGFAACKGNLIVKEMMDKYMELEFNSENMFQFPCPILNTSVLVEHGLVPNNTLQIIEGMTVYPTEYFCPSHPRKRIRNFTNNTVSIHHYTATWVPLKKRMVWKMISMAKIILPKSISKKIREIVRRIRR